MNKVNDIIDELKNDVDALPNPEHPKFIFIGGIPGSGKTLLIEKAKIDFPNDKFSVIEPDLYRKHFKNASTVEETVRKCNQIEMDILFYSLSKRKNVIHISSLRAFEYIDNLIREKIVPLGYDVYLYIIVTSKVVSALSTYERYIFDKQKSDAFPRLNKFEYLKQANNGFDLAINFLENTKYFKEVHVFKRGENMTLPSKIYIGTDTFANIVDAEEQRQMNDLDYKKINFKINSIREQLVLSNEKEEFEKVVQGIIYKYI